MSTADHVPTPQSQPPEAKRIIATLTGGFERRYLPVLAANLPAWVSPDILTSTGMVAALLIGILYSLSDTTPGLLWVINGLVIVHWYADSLDGTLARVRKIERPRYGFYVDHASDAITVLFVCLGLGKSTHMDMRIALGVLIGYYLIMIQVLLSSYTLREFKISYGRFGPTELRILLILVNTALWAQVVWLPQWGKWSLAGYQLRLMDVLGIIAALYLLVIFVVALFDGLKRLAALEPPGVKHE